MKNKIITLTAALMLTACASASQPGAMVPAVNAQSIVTSQSKLFESVNVGDIGGGKKTSPLWTSQVSNEDFAEALKQSFAAHAMLATDTGDYRLDAELIKLKQPVLGGLDMSVTSDIKYTLTNLQSGEVVFDQTINEKYTAKFGDALVGVKRLQLANEGSIKSNISALIDMMINQVDGLSPAVALSKPARPTG